MDIEQQEFSRSFRGYNEEEVDDFLDKIVKDYEELINENVRLNEEIERMQEKLKEFSEIEETLRSALLNAQKLQRLLGENISFSHLLQNHRQTDPYNPRIQSMWSDNIWGIMNYNYYKIEDFK